MTEASEGRGSRPRVLLVAEAANPEWVSVPLVGWSLARALGAQADVHLVTQVRNADAVRAAGWPGDALTVIDSERVARLAWRLSEALRGGANRGWTTKAAIQALAYPYFEHRVWRELGARVRAGAFDLVHRVTPLSPTVPSLLARRAPATGVPFVLGPLNGGVPWPEDFAGARRREREWLAPLRGAYRALPGVASTRARAAAILVGSRDTLAELPGSCRTRCVYIPENAVDLTRFAPPEAPPDPAGPLRLAFLGRLVPYKGADMLIDAAEPLLREGRATLDVLGDGPELPALQAAVAARGLGNRVRLPGWVPHAEVARALGRAEVLAFPSIREFGGGAVLEAMALGLVPVVVDYGGPGELVNDDCGVHIPLGPRAHIVAELRAALERLAGPERARLPAR
ncbi:MAG: glycosyltransferase family 4 protein, partial [Myxococcota bacterium]|nr:glycosyltransferase family 4 protein [Myxococcota bacterium]